MHIVFHFLTITISNPMIGREGNDLFSVLSTSPELSTVLYGNRGSDRFEIAPRNVDPVVSKNLRGHRGILEHTVDSVSDVGYDGMLVEGKTHVVVFPLQEHSISPSQQLYILFLATQRCCCGYIGQRRRLWLY